MRKDAKIALCVILALMVLVVVIWGRTQRGPDGIPDATEREQARLPEDDPQPALPDSPRASTPTRDTAPIYEPTTPAPTPGDFDPAPSLTDDRLPDPVAEAPRGDDGFTSPRMRTGMINHFGPLTDEERAAREAAVEPEDDPQPAGPTLVERHEAAPTLDDAMGRRTTERAVTGAPPVVARPQPGPTVKHTIGKGDTYQSLARKYYKSAGKWRLIYDANRIEPQKLAIGTVLTIPPLPDARPAAVATPPATRPTTTTGRTYEVKKGDNFYNIARVVYRDGNKWKKLYEANKSKLPKPNNPGSLRPGIVLDVPTLAASN